MSRFIVLCALYLIAPLGVIAQFDLNSFNSNSTAIADVISSLGDLSSVTGEKIELILDPQFPIPGERVVATVDDYAITSFGASIVWFIDGEEQSNVRNQRTINFVSSLSGDPTTIEVRVVGNGQSYSAQRTITPTYIDVIFEPLTYAPVHYLGRPQPIFGSRVLATALLHTKNGPVNPAEYSYTWRVDDAAIDGGAIRGKHRTLLTIPHGLYITIGITIQDNTGQTVARRLYAIPSVDIDTQFYEVSPLFGMSHKALSNGSVLFGEGSVIYAIPYNQDLLATEDSQVIEWRVGSRRVPLETNPYQLTITNVARNRSTIEFKIQNNIEFLQRGERSITIQI